MREKLEKTENISLIQDCAEEILVEDIEVQSKVEDLYNYMNQYAFDCSVEVFSYIGKGYSQNPEFKNNIDKFGEGVAEYTSKAIEVYCNSRLNK